MPILDPASVANALAAVAALEARVADLERQLHKRSNDAIQTKYADAIKALSTYLLNYETEHGRQWDSVDIGVYDNDGLRVSEVSYLQGSGGASAMRSTPESSAFILACEEFLLTHHIKPYRPEGWDSDIDYHGEAIWLLSEHLTTEEPKQ